MNAKRESQEDLFKPKPATAEPPQRGAALAGLRPTRPQVPAPPAATAMRFDAVPIEPEDDDETITSMVVYVDEATLKAVRAKKARNGGTYADIAEDALDAELAAVATAFVSGTQQESTGAMIPRRRRATGGRGRNQLAIRFSRGQQRWLDTQADAMGAPSRSAVVALALAIHLGTHTP